MLLPLILQRRVEPITPATGYATPANEYEGRYQIYVLSTETSRYEAMPWLLDWHLEGEDRATATLNPMEGIDEAQLAQMRQMGLEPPLQLKAHRSDQYYVVEDRRIEAALEAVLTACGQNRRENWRGPRGR